LDEKQQDSDEKLKSEVQGDLNSSQHQDDEGLIDENALLEEEEIRIKKLQVYENILKRITQLTVHNWNHWIESLDVLAQKLRVRDRTAIFEAAVFLSWK